MKNDIGYISKRGDMPSLGKAYNPPAKFQHGKQELVAFLKSERDGQDVELYEVRMPARFFEIKVLSRTTSEGKVKKGFILSSGSGQGELVVRIAKAIAKGMLGLKEKSIL